MPLPPDENLAAGWPVPARGLSSGLPASTGPCTMRLIRFLIALLCIAAGVVVGALNPQPVSLDLGFTTLRGTLGVSMLIALLVGAIAGGLVSSEEHTSELQSLMRISYAVFCLKKKK